VVAAKRACSLAHECKATGYWVTCIQLIDSRFLRHELLGKQLQEQIFTYSFSESKTQYWTNRREMFSDDVSASQLPCANVGINATTGLWFANECTSFRITSIPLLYEIHEIKQECKVVFSWSQKSYASTVYEQYNQFVFTKNYSIKTNDVMHNWTECAYHLSPCFDYSYSFIIHFIFLQYSKKYAYLDRVCIVHSLFILYFLQYSKTIMI